MLCKSNQQCKFFYDCGLKQDRDDNNNVSVIQSTMESIFDVLAYHSTIGGMDNDYKCLPENRATNAKSDTTLEKSWKSVKIKNK